MQFLAIRAGLGLTLSLVGIQATTFATPQACNTARVSLDTGGGDSNDLSRLPSISPDGDWVAFQSDATDLVAGDLNGFTDIFLRQLSTGTTLLVTRSNSGAQADGDSYHAAVSNDGLFVAYYSEATNLSHTPDTNNQPDAFVYDRILNRTRRVSISTNGVQANGNTGVRGLRDGLDISDDGHIVAFSSNATNLVAGDTNGWGDIFVHDHTTLVTRRVSVAAVGAMVIQSNGSSQNPVISGDGRFVAYMCNANNLDPADSHFNTDIYRTDLTTLDTRVVSVGPGGLAGNGVSAWPAINGDGGVVAFESFATDLLPGDNGAFVDVYLRDVNAGSTERISLTWDGQEASNYAYQCSVDAAGERVAFTSAAGNMIPNGSGIQSVYVRDRTLGTVRRWGEANDGAFGFAGSSDSSLDDTGECLAYMSLAVLEPADGNNTLDIYLSKCGSISPLSCDGQSVGCPCSNFGAPGRGCDNSSGTGGALCQAFGNPSVASDTVFLALYGAGPSVPALFFQGDGIAGGGAGIPFGDGWRCAGNNIRRLGVKITSGGHAVYGLGADVPVSIKGALPVVGGTRYYEAWYRDTANFCTAAQFNLSNTATVVWTP